MANTGCNNFIMSNSCLEASYMEAMCWVRYSQTDWDRTTLEILVTSLNFEYCLIRKDNIMVAYLASTDSEKNY